MKLSETKAKRVLKKYYSSPGNSYRKIEKVSIHDGYITYLTSREFCDKPECNCVGSWGEPIKETYSLENFIHFFQPKIMTYQQKIKALAASSGVLDTKLKSVGSGEIVLEVRDAETEALLFELHGTNGTQPNDEKSDLYSELSEMEREAGLK